MFSDDLDSDGAAWLQRKKRHEALAKALVNQAASGIDLPRVTQDVAKALMSDGAEDFQKILASLGRRRDPSALDLGVAALTNHIDEAGQRSLRIVGLPIFFRSRETALRWLPKMKATPKRGADAAPSPLALAAWSMRPVATDVDRYVLPVIASTRGAGLLVYAMPGSIEAAVAAFIDRPGATSLKALRRRLSHCDAEDGGDRDVMEFGAPGVHCGFALALEVASKPEAFADSDMGELQCLAQDDAVLVGTARSFVPARAEFLARVLLGRVRLEAGMDPWLGEPGEEIHVAEVWDGIAAAAVAPSGATAQRAMREPALYGVGLSLFTALKAFASHAQLHESPDRLPVARVAGAVDPASQDPDQIVAEIVAARRSFEYVAHLIEAVFKTSSSSGLLERRSLAEFAGYPISWSYFANITPKETTVGAALRETLGHQVSRLLEERGERHASAERHQAIVEAWARALLQMPVANIILSDEWHTRLLPWSRAPGERSEQVKTTERETSLTVGGKECTLRFAEWLCGSEPGRQVITRRFEADLLDGGNKIAAVAGGVMRLRAKDLRPSASAFRIALDAADDGYALLANRMLEIDTDIGRWFQKSAIAWITDIAVAPERRRQGVGKALTLGTLQLLTEHWGKFGALVADLHAPGFAMVPGRGGPADLRLLYTQRMVPGRRLLSNIDIVQEAFGPEARVVIFEMGIPLSQMEILAALGSALFTGDDHPGEGR